MCEDECCEGSQLPTVIGPQGYNGWSPEFAVITDGSREVLKLIAWIGGTGPTPTNNIGEYVGVGGFETLIANGKNIKGSTGATGATGAASTVPGPTGPKGDKGDTGDSASTPRGIINAWPTEIAPTGWLLCDGALVNKVTYTDLYDIILDRFAEGGDLTGGASTTFRLPNIKGKSIVGLDGTIVDFNAIGKSGGEKDHTLTYGETGVPVHSHTATQASHTHDYQDSYYQTNEEANDGGTGSRTSDFNSYDLTRTTTSATPAITVNDNAGTPATSHNNMSPYLILNYIIKY